MEYEGDLTLNKSQTKLIQYDSGAAADDTKEKIDDDESIMREIELHLVNEQVGSKVDYTPVDLNSKRSFA